MGEKQLCESESWTELLSRDGAQGLGGGDPEDRMRGHRKDDMPGRTINNVGIHCASEKCFLPSVANSLFLKNAFE